MSNFQIINLFPLSLYKSKIELNSEYKNELQDLIVKMKSKSQNLDYKSENKSWTGDTQGFENLHLNKKFEILYSKISSEIKKYINFLNIDNDQIDLFYQRSWATISDKIENISPHIHAQSHISFAYYLKKDSNDSNIVFFDQNRNNEIIPGLFNSKSINLKKVLKKRNDFNTSVVKIDVQENDIIIFPSKTLHATEQKNSNDSRISISADISIISKDAANLEHLTPSINNWKKF